MVDIFITLLTWSGPIEQGPSFVCVALLCILQDSKWQSKCSYPSEWPQGGLCYMRNTRCIVLHCALLHCTTMHWTALHNTTTLHCTARVSNTLHCTEQCCTYIDMMRQRHAVQRETERHESHTSSHTGTQASRQPDRETQAQASRPIQPHRQSEHREP